MQYSLTHADDLALAARHEAAAFARRVNLGRDAARKETKILMDLAHGLAEAGRFGEAVTVQLEIVDLYRASGSPGNYPLPDNVAWSLLDLAIYLDLAGRTEASLEIEQEILTLQRRTAEAEPRRVTGMVIWMAGAALRFLDIGDGLSARGLLREAVAACDQLPAEGGIANFGFHQGVQAVLFARSGSRDERPEGGRPAPVGVDPGRSRQPVAGRSLHHWAFSVREDYRAGLDAINQAIVDAGPVPRDPAGFGTLLRRRAIRRSVLCLGPQDFTEEIIPALAKGVDVERRLLDAERLSRALIDQALGHLVAGASARAAGALREAGQAV
ncbi:tetratricopeptide repeat protein [Winogradskya humida]|uniref:tetratricopeptide repeat protein n=1 Tax=Winogradskya humida TaxID=113566 RepID=UPI00194348F1|nr:tetratricopeptide repeat protein [Actinoplanes humidus]